jgi:hypothetical protein
MNGKKEGLGWKKSSPDENHANVFLSFFLASSRFELMLQCWTSDLAKRPMFPEISARLQAMQGEPGQVVQAARGQSVRQRGGTFSVHVMPNPAFLDDSTVLPDSDT